MDRERGSAVVDFALVGALLSFLFVALLQLALALHVRNVVIDAAGEGARYGALADRDPGAAVERTRRLISEELTSDYGQQVSARVVTVDGLALVEVTVDAPIPVVGLIGFGRTLHVSGHALAENP